MRIKRGCFDCPLLLALLLFVAGRYVLADSIVTASNAIQSVQHHQKSSRHCISVEANSTGQFIDCLGRQRFFRGLYVPFRARDFIISQEGSFKHYPAIVYDQGDAALISRLGFNLVRVGVLWSDAEVLPGKMNDTYLRNIEMFIQELRAQSIFVVVEIHQELFSAEYCGEGFPKWAVIPKSEAVINATAHQQIVDDLLECSFGKEADGFLKLYNNEDNLQTIFVEFWSYLATRFSKYDNVLGYNLLRNPWGGQAALSLAYAKGLVPNYADQNYLAPLYEAVAASVRAADPDGLIVFQESLTDSDYKNGVGFTEVPGGQTYATSSILGYKDISNAEDRVLASQKLGSGVLLLQLAASMSTGRANTIAGSNASSSNLLVPFRRHLGYLDRQMTSWAFVNYVPGHDGDHALLSANGTLNNEYVRSTSRPYPIAVSGTAMRYSFNHSTRVFSLRYQTHLRVDPLEFPSHPEQVAQRSTVVFLNSALHYCQGYTVVLRPPEPAIARWHAGDPNHLVITHSANVPDGTEIFVKVVPITAQRCANDHEDSDDLGGPTALVADAGLGGNGTVVKGKPSRRRITFRSTRLLREK